MSRHLCCRRCYGGLLLAHVASKEGIVAAKNIMGIDTTINYNVVPAAIFTSPEIASVGIREPPGC